MTQARCVRGQVLQDKPHLLQGLETPKFDLYIAAAWEAGQTQAPAFRVAFHIIQIALGTGLVAEEHSWSCQAVLWGPRCDDFLQQLSSNLKAEVDRSSLVKAEEHSFFKVVHPGCLASQTSHW